MDTLLRHLSDWRPFSALVVGDFMLDQLIYGDAERLSADAPVPILHVRRQEDRAGGAANVCLDLIALRADVHALGVIGDDAFGIALKRTLQQAKVHTAGLIKDESRPTTVKQSLVGLAQQRHPQKMFRVDYESREPLPASVVAELLDRIETLLPKVDVVCVEDYAKGVCTPEFCQGLIARARALGKPVFVDPAKLADYGKYRGATVITPNRTEAEFATGLRTHEGGDAAHNHELAQRLLATVQLEAVVLTLDRHGALLLEAAGPRAHQPQALPTLARQVYDVTGAGDMFLAGLAAGRANGADWPDAVRLANAAAGLEVEIFGVEPIPLEKIHASLIAQSPGRAGKRRTLDELMVEVNARRHSGQRVVFTNGCFDMLHPGHVALLEQAAKRGDFLVVGLNDDASVRRLKGPERPLQNEDHRAVVLGSLGCVGAVVLFGEDTPMKLLERLRPEVLVKGGDYTKDRVVGASLVESYGGEVALISLVPGHSTTSNLKKMKTTAGGTVTHS